MRAAGDAAHAKGSTGGVRQAIDALGASGVREVVASIDTYDPFESPNGTAERYERFRRHAVATRHAADRIAELARLRGAETSWRLPPCFTMWGVW